VHTSFFVPLHSSAPHPQAAHKFINFILDPHVTADITNEIYYGNDNLAARAFVRPEILNDPAIYPLRSCARGYSRRWNSTRSISGYELVPGRASRTDSDLIGPYLARGGAQRTRNRVDHPASERVCRAAE